MNYNYNDENDNNVNFSEKTNDGQAYHKVKRSGGSFSKYGLDKCDHSGFVKTLALICIIFLVVLFGIFILSDNSEILAEKFGKDSIVAKISQNLSKSSSSKEHADYSLPFGMRRQNILFLGVDSNGDGSDLWEGTRTDTIILMNIDPKTKTVNAISIPRDSKVFLAGDGGIQKINAAHAIGGIDMTIKTIEETLGVKIDRYIMVHDDAVKELVKALGGIDIYIEKDMRYHDYAGNLHIDLKKGDKHLDADEAVGYLRFRHDAMGDIGRTQRQQWFLKGVLEKLKQPQTIARIPEIITVANKYVKTNMSMYEMSQYAALAKHFDIDKIEIALLPGAPNKRGYTSYWILDPEKTQEVVDRLIYRIKPANVDYKTAQFTANVMYAPARINDAQTLIDELGTFGVNVNCTGEALRTHSQFIAHSSSITNDYYNWLKKKVPALDVNQFVFEPVHQYCSGADYTIILSGK